MTDPTPEDTATPTSSDDGDQPELEPGELADDEDFV